MQQPSNKHIGWIMGECENNKTISFIIVDDALPFRNILRKMIGSQVNWSIAAEAGDGLTATQLVLELVPDVLLMDTDMPIMNGFEATREIRRLVSTTRIILFSGHRDEEFRQASSLVGSDYYFEKEDVSLQSLIQIVTQFFPYPIGNC